MESITLKVGSVYTINNHIEDYRKTVTFEGERIGHVTWYTDSRGMKGVTQNLYKINDTTYVVYEIEWSQWTHDTDWHTLHQDVTEEDLQYGKRFERLGIATGLARPMSLEDLKRWSSEKQP